MRKLFLALAFLSAFLTPLRAQSLSPELEAALSEENPVAAVVDGWPIYWNDVIRSAASLPPEYHEAIDLLFPALLSRLVDLRLLAEEARTQGYAEKEDIKRQIELAEDKVVRDALVVDLVTAAIDEQAVQDRVELLQASGPRDEVYARIIVCLNEAAAKQAAKALSAGEEFAQVAVRLSVHASATDGGLLGWVAQGEVEPEKLNDALFSLKIGEYTPQPLATEIGWVIAKIDDKRTTQPLTPNELADRIRHELVRLSLDRLLADLREKHDIEIFPNQQGEP